MSTPPVDVAAIRAALAKATPGPWESDRTFWKIGSKYPGMDHFWHDILAVSARPIGRFDDSLPNGTADAELIVLLRNNAEALLDALERAQAASEGLDMLVAQAERRGATDAWSKGLVSGIGFATRMQRDPETWEPVNPYRDAIETGSTDL